MSERLITTEIVRRYLVALRFPSGDVDMISGLLLELPVPDVLDVIVACPEGPATEWEAHEALVLCAAAERLLAESDEHVGVASGRLLISMASGLLDSAGVPLARWEEARNA
jgi:hypothetical protein